MGEAESYVPPGAVGKGAGTQQAVLSDDARYGAAAQVAGGHTEQGGHPMCPLRGGEACGTT